MKLVNEKADPALTKVFLERLRHIKANYKQCASSVQSCLDNMSEEPSMLELQVATFVVNGGFLFKYGIESEEDRDFTELLEEMSLFAGDKPESES